MHLRSYGLNMDELCFTVTSILLSLFAYCQIPHYDFLNDRLKQYMQQYNDTVRGAHMDLVFFKDAMVHLIKVRKHFLTVCIILPCE